MRDMYKDLLQMDAATIPASDRTWADIASTPVASRTNRRRRSRSLLKPFAAGLVITVGGTVALSWVSPAMAKAMRNVPVLNKIVPVEESPVVKKYSVSTGQTGVSTDQGITFRVPKVFYDGTKLTFNYYIDVPASYQSTDSQNHPQIDFQHATFEINGQSVSASMQGGDTLVQPGHYQGNIDMEGIAPGTPDKGTLTVNITKIGSVTGHWALQILISAAALTSQETQASPMASKTFGGVSLTVKKITFGPATTSIEYELVQPYDSQGKTKYNFKRFEFEVGVFNQDGKFLQPAGISSRTIQADGNREIDDWTETFNSFAKKPTSLSFKPTTTVWDANVSTPVVVPFQEQFPIELNHGKWYGSTVINNIDFQSNQTLVYISFKEDSLEHPNFWFEDEHGQIYKRAGNAPDGSIIFPAIKDTHGLKICTTTGIPEANGPVGHSVPIPQLDLQVPIH